MDLTDKEYYHRRAEEELRMAESARSPEATKAHYTLAGYYLDHVFQQADRPQYANPFGNGLAQLA